MKAHRTDRVSLIFGLIFLATVGWWLFGRRIDLAFSQVGWLIAAGLIILGTLGLIGALRPDRGRIRAAPIEPPGGMQPPPTEPVPPVWPPTDRAWPAEPSPNPLEPVEPGTESPPVEPGAESPHVEPGTESPPVEPDAEPARPEGPDIERTQPIRPAGPPQPGSGSAEGGQ